MNKAAVRRALTTLSNQYIITPFKIEILKGIDEGMVEINFKVNAELIMPKKKIRIKNGRKRNIQN